MKLITWSATHIDGGKKIKIKLNEPPHNEDFYKDVFLIAFLNTEKQSVFQQNIISVKINGVSTVTLTDGNPYTFEKYHLQGTNDTAYIDYFFSNAFQPTFVQFHFNRDPYEWGIIKYDHKGILPVQEKNGIYASIV